MKKGIRNRYEEEGVENYYALNGPEYENPHFPQVRALLLQNESRIDYEKVLDLCCGGGEVSRVLGELGYPLPLASDPFTAEAYRQHFEKPCLPFNFDDLIRGALEAHGPFTAVICSFAMHLCPADKLFPLSYQLFLKTRQLVVISPHKRPQLEKFEGIQLGFTDFVHTERGKRVFLKSYHSNF